MSSKQKVNDKCSCGSGKKYKKCCKWIHISSASMITEQKRINEEKVYDIIEEYIKLPNLPNNTEINIDKIGIYNYNSKKRKIENVIKYDTFTFINPKEYPVGKNSDLDYMPDEYVSPVIIIDTNGIKYKVNYLYWFPLIDIHDGIVNKQGIIGKKIFPKKIFIDKKGENNSIKWISDLLNLIGNDILSNLPPLK